MKVIKRSKRNAVSRLLYSKNDKDVIAAWKQDLTRILHVFNVCSVVPVRLSLIVCMQTELAMNTHGIVSDVHHGVVDTHNMVAEMYRSMLQNQSVSDVYTPFYCRVNKC